MSRRVTFRDICGYLAAYQCRQAGQSVKQIAASAKKSPATIYRWLTKFPNYNPRRRSWAPRA